MPITSLQHHKRNMNFSAKKQTTSSNNAWNQTIYLSKNENGPIFSSRRHKRKKKFEIADFYSLWSTATCTGMGNVRTITVSLKNRESACEINSNLQRSSMWSKRNKNYRILLGLVPYTKETKESCLELIFNLGQERVLYFLGSLKRCMD